MLRILLVDNDLHVLRAISRLMTRGGHAVTACGTVEEARQVIGTGARIDLLVLDHSLGTGAWYVELGTEARRTNPTVEILLLSAAHPEGSQIADRVASLTKPVRAAALLEAIERVCVRN